jgi:DNA-binding response OmpR family regulator
VSNLLYPARPLTVLIVDDDRDGAESLATVLQAYGYDARTACTATTAVIEAEAFRPDAVVMDIGIPGTDGYRLAGRLCEMLGRRPLLVAVTGYGDLEDRSRQEGFDHHFLKPADLAELAGVLAAHAGRGPRATHTTSMPTGRERADCLSESARSSRTG